MVKTIDSYTHVGISESDLLILEAYGYTVVEHQVWQFGLFHPDIPSKFVWYPRKGTLMREVEGHNITKLGEYHGIEDVIAKMNEYLS